MSFHLRRCAYVSVAGSQLINFGKHNIWIDFPLFANQKGKAAAHFNRIWHFAEKLLKCFSILFRSPYHPISTILPCPFLFECVWFNSNNYNNNHIHIRKASLVVWCTLFLYKILIVAFQYILESNQIRLNQPEVQLIKLRMVDALAAPSSPSTSSP